MAGKKGQINRNVQKCKTSCEIITGFKLGQVDKLLKTISAVLYMLMSFKCSEITLTNPVSWVGCQMDRPGQIQSIM